MPQDKRAAAIETFVAGLLIGAISRDRGQSGVVYDPDAHTIVIDNIFGHHIAVTMTMSVASA